MLHDAVLHHFFLGGEDEREYVAEFVYNYGHWSEDLARELWRRRSRSAADPEYFRYPMIKRVVERSRAVIVHNPRAAALVQEHVRGTTVHEIPHLFELPADLPCAVGSDPMARRVGDQIAYFPGGRVRTSAGIQALAGAVASFPARAPLGRHDAAGGGRFRLVAIWRGRSSRCCGMTPVSCESAIWTSASFGCAPRRWTPASICVIPWRGKPPGIAIRLMGLGQDRSGERGRRDLALSGNGVRARSIPGQAEEDMLAEYLVWLARCPDDARAIGQRAAGHIREHHSPARVAGLYWRA